MVSTIQMSQGAGGEHMDRLIKEHILSKFSQVSSYGVEVPLSCLDDAAVIDDIVFSTDSHTVQPLIFPGGDIGSLAIAGTVNDVAVLGADPLALSTVLRPLPRRPTRSPGWESPLPPLDHLRRQQRRPPEPKPR